MEESIAYVPDMKKVLMSDEVSDQEFVQLKFDPSGIQTTTMPNSFKPGRTNEAQRQKV